MNPMKKLALVCLAATSANTFAADNNNSSEQSLLAESKSMFYLSLGSVGLDAATSKANGVGDSATYVRLGWKAVKDNGFTWGLGLSGFLYDDKEGFSQTTQNQYGSVQDSSSSAESFNGYGEGGYTYSVNEKIDVSIMGGYELVFSSQRSIPNCTNCSSSDIDLDAGLYIAPSASVKFNHEWYGEVGFISYLSGDAGSAFTFTVGAQF